MILRRWLVVVAVVSGLTGCAADQSLSSEAAEDLQQRVEKVRDAVRADDTDAASRRLLELERAVTRWLDSDALTEGRAARILSAATAVAARLDAIAQANPEPTPTITLVVTETATETVTPSPSETEDEDFDFDRGHGKDKDG